MHEQSALRWSWMNVLTAKRCALLIERFKDLDTALANVSCEMLRELGCREDTAMLAMNRLEELDAKSYGENLRKRDITLISFLDEAYPSLLSEIDDRPTFLHFRGDPQILTQPCVALVGARAMTDYGKRVVGHFVPALVAAGAVTVSGLAEGIDAEVARETLRADGKTVAVLGHGMGMMYPKAHERLADNIVDAGGLIISEFPLDIRPDKFTFPARNRIIAGLSMGTVVLEAAEGSGSLITADLALDYNRDVFAVPGQIFDPNYAGCHRLLSRGTAKLVTCADDVLQEWGMARGDPLQTASSFEGDNPEEQAVWSALTAMPSSLDDLVVKAKLDAATINAVLTILELQGAAKNVGGGQWVRT